MSGGFSVVCFNVCKQPKSLVASSTMGKKDALKPYSAFYPEGIQSTAQSIFRFWIMVLENGDKGFSTKHPSQSEL